VRGRDAAIKKKLTDPAVLAIASGARDFLPLINVAHKRTWSVEVTAFSAQFRASMEIDTTTALPGQPNPVRRKQKNSN
jgi:hypothetical protein